MVRVEHSVGKKVRNKQGIGVLLYPKLQQQQHQHFNANRVKQTKQRTVAVPQAIIKLQSQLA